MTRVSTILIDILALSMDRIMKNYALPLALLSVFALQACNEQTATAVEEVAPAAASSSDDVALETTEQRLSYGIAYSLGQRIAADGVPLDGDAFAAGIRDVLEGKEPRLNQEEMSAEMMAYQQKTAADQQANQAVEGEANMAAAVAFLEANAAREGVMVTESGLQYEIVKAGEGAKPAAGDQVEVHYRGTLIDGTPFDSSYDRGEPVTFGVTQVIPGWTEALQMMSVGSTWKLAIPSGLAYGPGGAGNGLIGPNAALLFDVELLSIPTQAAAEATPEAAAPAEG